jgi:hypothetical protein
MTPRDETLKDLISAAERAVAAFEGIADGQPYTTQREAARSALHALRSAAMARLSPFAPWGADVIADFELAIQSARRQDLAQLLVGIMPQCLESHPKLARLLVAPPVIEMVRSCNETVGAPEREFEIELEYLQAQCAHLKGRDEFEPAATILAEASVQLAETCRAAEERLERGLAA